MHYEEKESKYAKKGVANTALGLGIAGTALGVVNSGWLGGRSLFGRGGYENGYERGNERGGCNPCRGVATCDDLMGIERQFICQEREIGHLALGFEKQLGANALYQQSLTYNQALASQKGDCDLALKEACDVKDLYRYNDKTAFELYKSQRDAFDIQQKEIDCLKAELAVTKAIRPYQDKLIDEKIERNAMIAAFNLERRTCKMISGEVVLPSTPTVTGFASFQNCGCAIPVVETA